MSHDNQAQMQHLETLAIHAGYTPEETTKAVAVPIYHTTSYAFDNTQHGADLFDLKVQGNIYTRIMNPTNAVLEERVAALEGGVGALAVASGMAAITYTIQTICEAGDNIVAVSTLYGGTYNLFAHALPRQGIEVRFFDYQNPEAIRDLIDDKTKMVFAESIGNPLGNIVDIQALSDIAHEFGVPLVIDNTVATPVLCRPFDFGADIVVHALTKYMSGTGTSIGGAIVDSGKFPWGDYPERFALLNTPDASYHGVNFVKDIGAAAFIARARVAPLRNMGAAMSPFNAFSILQGIETLSLRMERHVENAQAVAEYLIGHDKVAWVKYAGLSDQIQRLDGLLVTMRDSKRRNCGEDGYLDQACVAPPGQDQKGYIRSLLQAAWCYMDFLGGPEDMLSADEAAMEKTTNRYPHLCADHIAEALNHIHIQVFGQPLQRQSNPHD